MANTFQNYCLRVDTGEAKDWTGVSIQSTIPIPKEQIDSLWQLSSFTYQLLSFNDYQAKCYSTAIYPADSKVIYPLLGLIGEVGEVAEKIRDYLYPQGPPKEWDDCSLFLKSVYHSLDDAANIGISAGKISKIVRDKEHKLPPEHIKALKDKVDALTETQKNEISKECGDCGWFLATSLGDMNIKMGDIAQYNLDKLAKRKEAGTLGGSGDSR